MLFRATVRRPECVVQELRRIRPVSGCFRRMCGGEVGEKDGHRAKEGALGALIRVFSSNGWVWDGTARESSGRRLLGPQGGRDLGTSGLGSGHVSHVTTLGLEPKYFRPPASPSPSLLQGPLGCILGHSVLAQLSHKLGEHDESRPGGKQFA
jgi:hypothetical protein